MGLIADGLKAISATTALVFLLSSQPPPESLMGTFPVPGVAGSAQTNDVSAGGVVVGQGEQTILQWAIREGGAFAVILVILFFYRRDWKTAVDFWRDQHAITTDLVVAATKAQAETAAALRENNVVVHSMKQVIQTYVPNSRRIEDGSRP